MFNSTVVNWVLQCGSSSISSSGSFASSSQNSTNLRVTRGKIPGVTKTFISDINPNKIKHQTSHM
jgi:hypothetical protein